MKEILAWVLILSLWPSGLVYGQSFSEKLKARPLYAPPPNYNPLPNAPEKDKHLSGTGLFTVYVWPDGTVRRVETTQSTGHAVLDKAAVDGLYKWRWGPHTVATIEIPIQFRARQRKN